MRFFDLHCDTITRCFAEKQPLLENNFHLSLKRGKGLSPWFQCFAVWMPDELRGEEAWDYFRSGADCFRKELTENAGAVMQVRSAEDLERAESAGKCGAILTLEGASALGGELSRLQELSSLGVRIVTLTWNGRNELGDGALVENPKGLTDFGRKCLGEMKRLGIAADLSHASEPLFYDALECCGPVLATHSDSKALCPHRRNLTDEQFCLLRDRGGLVGLNFCVSFLREKGHADFSDILRHAEHFLSLGGEKALAMGSDFDGTDLPEGMDGIQSIESLADCFARRGFSDGLIDDIFFGNARRFFASLWTNRL